MPTDPAEDRALLVGVGEALLMAAITMRDITSALNPGILATCPPDILDRLTRIQYQEAFDALPADVRARARESVDADPAIIAARRVDEEGRHAG